MGNLLAHSLFALALHSGFWALVSGRPMTHYAFFAAIVALLPDVDRGKEGARSVFSHSLGYGVAWSMLSLAILSFASTLGLIAPSAIFPLQASTMVGLWSHLLLDSAVPPGIFGIPYRGRWSLVHINLGLRLLRRLDLAVSSASAALILLLLALG